MLADAATGLVEVFRELLGDWSAADVAQLATLLTRLNETISAAQTTPPAPSKNRWQAAPSTRTEGDLS